MPTPGEMIAAQQAPAPMAAPGAQEPAPPQPGTQENVVLDAFRTIMQFIATRTEMGDPNAPAMQDALRQLVEYMSAPAGGAPGQGGPAAPPQSGRVPLTPPQGGANPMLGTMGNAAQPDMRGKVPVI